MALTLFPEAAYFRTGFERQITVPSKAAINLDKGAPVQAREQKYLLQNGAGNHLYKTLQHQHSSFCINSFFERLP